MCRSFVFLISVFYLPDNSRIDIKKQIKRKIKHITSIAVVSVALYVVIAYVDHCINQDNINVGLWLQLIVTKSNIITFLLLNNLSFIKAGHLWFLLALIYDYIILYLCYTKAWYRYLYISIPILLVLLILVNDILVLNWHYSENFLLTGLLYVLTGNYLSLHKYRLKSLSNGLVLMG